MAILLYVWQAIVAVVIVVLLTWVAVSCYWRRRLRELESCHGRDFADIHREHQDEVRELKSSHERDLADIHREHQEKVRELKSRHRREHQEAVRGMIETFKHQALNCLRPIKDTIDSLKEKLKTQPTSEQEKWQHGLETSLRKIEEYESRLTQLIENLAILSRLETPNPGLRFSEHKLDTIVGDVVRDLSGRARAKQVELTWWVQPEDFPRVTADANALRQVFVNLIDNAIKYCSENGEVSVALEAMSSKNVVHARVSDTGVGILKEDWERIFDKGYTVEQAGGRQPREGGQGLGLHIVKLIVDKHRGGIGVQKSNLGEGTTFELTLPIRRP